MKKVYKVNKINPLNIHHNIARFQGTRHRSLKLRLITGSALSTNIALAVITGILLFPNDGKAANSTWNGSGGSTNWSDPGNWDFVPGPGDDVTFSGATQTNNNNDIASGTSFGAVNFNGGSAFTLNGNALGITNGINNSSAALQTFNLVPTFIGNQTIQSIAGGSLAFGNTTLSASNLTIAGGGNVFFNAAINEAGASSLTVNTAGTVQFGVANSFTGGTTLNAGTIIAVGAGALGTGTFNFNGGALQASAGGAIIFGNLTVLSGVDTINGPHSITFTNFVSGTGTLVVNTNPGNGIVLTRANTYTGGTQLAGGNLIAGNNTALGTGALTILASSTGAFRTNVGGLTIANDVNLIGNGILDGGNSFALTGIISGAGNLAITNTATTTLSGANIYTGNTGFVAGTLVVNNNNALGTGTLNFTGGGTGTLNAGAGGFNIANNVTLTGNGIIGGANNLTLSGLVSGTGTLTINNTATTTLAGNNTYSGSTAINALATLNLSGDTSAVSGNISNNGGLKFSQAASSSYGGVISGAGTLTQQGGGTLTLSGANIYSGLTTVNAGAGLNFTGDTSGLTGNTNSAGALVFSQAASSSYSGAISGGGTLTQQGTGTLTLSGNNNYSGATTISSGTLILTGSTAALTSNINDNSALVFGQAAATSYNGNITGTGTFVQNGAGALTLGGVNTYSGATMIANSVILSAGSALSANSDLTVNGLLNLAGHNATSASLAGTGGISLGAGTLTTGDATSTNYSGTISGTGGLTLQGTGILSLSGAAGAISYTGATTINSGTLELANTTLNNTTALKFNGGALQGSNALSLSNMVMLIGAGTISGSNNVTLTGAISGVGGLTVNNSAVTKLSSASTYAGGTNLVAGTLIVGNNTALGSGALSLTGGVLQASAPLTLNNTISLTGTGTVAGNTNLTFNGAVSGAGDLTLANSATTTLSGGNTSSGITTVAAGTVMLGSNTALSANSALIVTGGVLNLVNHNETSLSLAGSGPIILGTGTLTTGDATNTLYSGAISGTGGFTKQGSGTLSLSGASSFTGNTTINAGVLSINAANNLGAAAGVVNLNNATLQIAAPLTLSRNLVLGSGVGTIDTNGNATTFTGTTSGTGGLTKIGLGTLTLSGAQNYNGPTVINAGAVMATGGTLGNGSAVTINSNGALTLSASKLSIGNLDGAGALTLNSTILTLGSNDANSLYAGSIDGTGGLTKVGKGNFTFDGIAVNSGIATITSGQFVLGDASSPFAKINGSVMVGTGAMLSGYGAIGGTLTNSGTVTPAAPGTIGTLAVGGNFVQTSSGTLNMTLNTTTSSKLAVNGSAQLNGTLALQPITGVYNAGTKYVILTANGGISGNFSAITDTLPLRYTAIYSANSVDILLVGTSFLNNAKTLNQLSIARYLDTFNSSQPGFFKAANVAGVTNPQLDQLGPEGARGISQSTLLYTRQFTSGVQDVALGAGTSFGQGTQGVTLASRPDLQRFQFASNDVNDDFAQASGSKRQLHGFGAWGEGIGAIADVNVNHSNTHSVSTRIGGYTVGGDYHFSDQSMIGIAGGYGHTQFKLRDIGQKGDINHYGFAAYGRWQFDPVYLAGTLGYDTVDAHEVRYLNTIDNSTAKGSASGRGEFGAVELGYLYRFNQDLGAAPFAAVDASRATIDKFSEINSQYDLSIANQHATSVHGVLGTHFSWASEIADIKTSALLTLGVSHEFANRSNTLTAGFVSDPGSSFSITSAQPQKTSGLIELSLGVALSQRSKIFVSYNGEYNQRDSKTGVTGGVTLSW